MFDQIKYLFIGRNKNVSFLLLWYLDLILAFLLLLRGILIPLNSWEIITSQPFIKYIPDHSHQYETPPVCDGDGNERDSTDEDPSPPTIQQLLRDEPDELVAIPIFEINFTGLVYGIFFGMDRIGVDSSLLFSRASSPSSSSASSDRSLQDLRTSFRWRLMRLNRILRRGIAAGTGSGNGNNLPS